MFEVSKYFIEPSVLRQVMYHVYEYYWYWLWLSLAWIWELCGIYLYLNFRVPVWSDNKLLNWYLLVLR